MLSHSVEELLESMVTLRRDNDALRMAAAHANQLLDSLATLLTVGSQEDPFARVFASLRSTFRFAHAVALIEDGERLECIAADPSSLIGSTWAMGRLFAKVAGGKVTATFSNRGLAEWRMLASVEISPDQPALYLPIQMRDRRGIVILLQAFGSAGFDRRDVELARKFALLASQALVMHHTAERESESLQLRRLSEELARRADYDDLTGLPNRAFLKQTVTTRLAERREDCFALVFIDIDHFKQINDYYTHASGDALLKHVAKRIRSAVRETDILARISGDEFILLLSPLSEPTSLEEMLRRLSDELRPPFLIESYTIYASASMGVSLYPEHGTDYETLRRNADGAMYRAKSAGKGGVTYFDSAMSEALTAHMDLEQRLRRGISEHQFFCVFQPKIAVRSRRIVGFEALVRWRDDAGVVRPPGMFIDLAVELGLINALTNTIVEQALKAFVVLDPRFGSGTTISINLAARQATDIAFITALAAKLQISGFARRIILELTEDAVIATQKFQEQVLPLLRLAGVGVSIDDFGTGYSSLAALSDITADEVKVDRSFITAIHQRPRSQGILKAIVSLAESLGITLVAEGVETAEELNYLTRETSISLVQGYLFCKPLLLEELLTLSSADLVDRPLAMHDPATTNVAPRAKSRPEVRALRA